MVKHLQEAFAIFQFAIPGAVPMLALFLVNSFPGVFTSFREKRKLHSSSQGRLAIAEMSSFVLSIVILFAYSLWITYAIDIYSADLVTYIRGHLGSLVATLSFCLCMMGYLITMRPTKKSTTKE